MLWRFGYASTSSIDSLLARETPPSMEELMDDQDILAECKAMNHKLMHYLGSKDAVNSLLHWVIAGLDDLDNEAALADSQNLDRAMNSEDVYPAYRPPLDLSFPGLSPNSPPLEPAKMVDDIPPSKLDTSEERPASSPIESASSIGLGRGLERRESSDESSRSRFPLIATEILTSEMWTIGDCVMNNTEELLKPFWDAVLPDPEPSTPSTESSVSRQELTERERITYQYRSEADDERDRKRELLRGRWGRVNGYLLLKRTPKMIEFIQSLPNVIERLLLRISSTAVQELLVRILASEEDGVDGTPGVIDWLANEGLIPRLIALLSPEYPPTMHTIAADLLTSIITLCTPPAFNPAGGNAPEQPPTADSQQPQQPKSRDNRLIRELVSDANVSTLVGFMLDAVEVSDAAWPGLDESGPHPADPFIIHSLPSLASASSSISAICAVIVELIRRNNSDFSESHLFHTLRNRLMWIRMKTPEVAEAEEDAGREEMEKELEQTVERHGIVHLGTLLKAISDRFGHLHNILLSPRTQQRLGSAQNPAPLTLERFRVVELYAELLHSSNMSILNRPSSSGPVYTAEGVLSGGLAGLEALGEAIEADRQGDENDGPEMMVTQAKELPVSVSSAGSMSGSSVASDDEEILEGGDKEATPSPSPSASGHLPPPDMTATPTQKSPLPLPDNVPADDAYRIGLKLHSTPPRLDPASSQTLVDTDLPQGATRDDSETPTPRTSADTVSSVALASSMASDPIAPPVEFATPANDSLPPGDRLKQIYIQHRVLPTVLDLFFEYPNNNFLHHVVYDLLQQILNGRLAPGWNRELVLHLLRDAKLTERIIEAQHNNDERLKKPKTARSPCMGHIVLIAEELVKFFSRCPDDLMDIAKELFDHEEWEEFVDGSLRETKDRDTRPLAGGKPSIVPTSLQQQADEDSSDEEEDPNGAKFGEPLTRTKAQDGFINRQGFDSFAEHEAEEDERYWGATGRRTADSSDEDEDDAGWLRPSVRHFDSKDSDDDDFGAFQATAPASTSVKDEFDDDDAWGTFASSSSANDSDNPFADDNFTTFTPSVPPAPASTSTNDHLVLQHDPLTPHDWASQFDKEFADDDLPVVPLGARRPSVLVSGQDAEGPERQIVVPEFEDSPVLERSPWAIPEAGSPSLKATTGSTWVLAGGEGDDAEEIRYAVEPANTSLAEPIPRTLEASTETAAPTALGLSAPVTSSPAPIPVPKGIRSSPSLSPTIQPMSPRRSVARSPTSPMTIPQRSPASHSDIPPLRSLSPRAFPSPPKAGQPSSPIRPGTSSSQIRPTIPSPSAPSHHRSSSMSSTGGSPRRLIRRLSMGSPPDKALLAAVSKEQPLGPGVSGDTHLTAEGLLEKTIDGKSVTVPADEVIMGLEEAEDEEIEQMG